MNNKNFLILEIGTFQRLSLKIISEAVKYRGNPSTYYRNLLNTFIEQQKTSKLDEK